MRFTSSLARIDQRVFGAALNQIHECLRLKEP